MNKRTLFVALMVVVILTTAACGFYKPYTITPYDPAPGLELECLTVEGADNYIITLYEDIGVKTTHSGNVSNGSRIGFYLEPGDYTIGMTLGENAIVSLEPVNLTSFSVIVNECETTHWLEITLTEGVWLWVEYDQVPPPGQQL